MPWTPASQVEQRYRFVVEASRGEVTITELCELYGISRKTGYKWLERFDAKGRVGLEDMPRTALNHPHAVDPLTLELLLQSRRRHTSWGPRKLLAWLEGKGHSGLPAASTLGDLLKRHGLVQPRRRRRRHRAPWSTPFADCHLPNDVWCADFKGQFRVGTGEYCYPLTITDAYSRYLLRCVTVPGTTTEATDKAFESSFREYGLPKAIHTDNGIPFAAATPGGLTRLSVGWVKLGIRLERSQPGHPEQNGRHERMHLTLKRETASPAHATLRTQQRAFDAFRREYNHERPHEALGQRPPASAYLPSSRPYPRRVLPLEYPSIAEVRVVASNGTIRWRNERIFLTTVLAGEPVGLEEVNNDCWLLTFGIQPLGFVTETGSLRHLR
jgi:transposase InsO family protein